jgi:hypothetical protein
MPDPGRGRRATPLLLELPAPELLHVRRLDASAMVWGASCPRQAAGSASNTSRLSTSTPMDERASGSTAAAGPIGAVRWTDQVRGPLGAQPRRSIGITKREG